MAARVCRCGAQLLAVGQRVKCRRCGAPAALWLVASDTGGILGAATVAELALRDGLLAEIRGELARAVPAEPLDADYRVSLPGSWLST